MVESFSSVSKVGSLSMSMAQNLLCRISVDSRSLSRITFEWLEVHGLGSSEGDDGRSVSLENLGETNGEINLTSSNGSWLGRCSDMGLARQGI
jgi:hypothetical protein